MMGHHPDRIHSRPGDQMGWHEHQALHQGESQALNDLGIRGDAFNRAWGNQFNSTNLPERRQYGNY